MPSRPNGQSYTAGAQHDPYAIDQRTGKRKPVAETFQSLPVARRRKDEYHYRDKYYPDRPQAAPPFWFSDVFLYRKSGKHSIEEEDEPASRDNRGVIHGSCSNHTKKPPACPRRRRERRFGRFQRQIRQSAE